MAYTNIAEALIKTIQANWSLGGDLAAASMKFNEGWYNAEHSEYPQITASYGFPISDDEWFFGSDSDADEAHYISRELFMVNCWLKVPARSDPEDYEDDIEAMRREAHKILKNKWKDFTTPTNIGAVLPRNRGTNLNEITKMPRMLRREIEVQVNIRE